MGRALWIPPHVYLEETKTKHRGPDMENRYLIKPTIAIC